MIVFNLFLEATALFLSFISLVLIYTAIEECKESQFVPIYYFIGMSVTGVIFLSLARIEATFWGNGFILNSQLLQDLFVSYIALFLFGTLWQSYEAEICIPSFVDEN